MNLLRLTSTTHFSGHISGHINFISYRFQSNSIIRYKTKKQPQTLVTKGFMTVSCLFKLIQSNINYVPGGR